MRKVTGRMSEFERPRWLRDLLRFVPLKSQFVLSGNVRDQHLCEVGPGQMTALPLIQAVTTELLTYGYGHVIGYDLVSGFRAMSQVGAPKASAPEIMGQLGLTAGHDGTAPAGLEVFTSVLGTLKNWTGEPVALIVDFASRLIVRTDSLSLTEHCAFTSALVLAQTATTRPAGAQRRPFFNTVVWIVDREGDLPDWLLIGNPRIRHIPVAKPDIRARLHWATSLVRGLSGFRETPPEDVHGAIATFAEQTEGLLLADMSAIAQLGKQEGLGISEIGDAVRRYKVGVTEDPWARIPRGKISRGAEALRKRVKGQDHAVTFALDIIKRAITGVGGAGRGGRPRGVMFLAGPTGVGKTELAKALTSLLFGDERAYTRFDMSEFSAEHSDQRLIGAPPGYIGYDMGGELTNAVRERPFGVYLFDEIEKAHPRILDKFLQILDDGVLTSGRGDTVYFSEALIVFTSNLGIYRTDLDGRRVANVNPGDPFPEVQTKVRLEIGRHFKETLNRPEILNRIGDNILVFDFIRQDVADQIFESMLAQILKDVSQGNGMSLSIHSTARTTLKSLCLADLSNGGRGDS